MVLSKVIGYAAKAVGMPLEKFTYEQPELGKHDIRVAVTHCGVCHTDIHAVENYYGITAFPFVPGHEIVGHVAEVGSAVSGLKVGNRVGIGWQGRSCMKCEWCLQGKEHLCMDIVEAGSWVPYGGFSTSVLVDYRFAYPLPDALPSEDTAVLMCAGVAVFSPLQSYATRTSQKIGIIGVGGLGHLAIQFARSLDYEITAISSSPEKKEQSIAFGADHFIDSNDQINLEKAEYNFDLLLCTASNNVNWGLLSTLKKNGSMILVGFPDIKFNSTDLVAHQLSITGSFLGNRATMQEMLLFAEKHRIKPMLEIMPMTKVNEAMRKVKEGKARYRIVLENDINNTES